MNVLFDPKCDWALRHLEEFPVEINRASYQTLLRVPGIGVKSAQRIVKARRLGSLDFPDLKRIGVVLKRALYFITCRGKTLYPVKIEEDYITRTLLYVKEKLPPQLQGDVTYRQLSLFDDGMPLSFGEQAGLLAAEGQELLTAGADAGGAGRFVCRPYLCARTAWTGF